ncbi:hypothetical protein GMRT_10739 [Giardia muris]|uniref:Uncharacterized protein n=1 Tax=Giardia muris TaxID=5742 RepID=A0A4Z1T958_GIAMU|nr:hypothetical protein GMRT_10739 [Giardia muris]|eukprot:TNJ30673.1 hypothetical protein GMRT_10739 [Giardia muris]
MGPSRRTPVSRSTNRLALSTSTRDTTPDGFRVNPSRPSSFLNNPALDTATTQSIEDEIESINYQVRALTRCVDGLLTAQMEAPCTEEAPRVQKRLKRVMDSNKELKQQLEEMQTSCALIMDTNNRMTAALRAALTKALNRCATLELQLYEKQEKLDSVYGSLLELSTSVALDDSFKTPDSTRTSMQKLRSVMAASEVDEKLRARSQKGRVATASRGPSSAPKYTYDSPSLRVYRLCGSTESPLHSPGSPMVRKTRPTPTSRGDAISSPIGSDLHPTKGSAVLRSASNLRTSELGTPSDIRPDVVLGRFNVADEKSDAVRPNSSRPGSAKNITRPPTHSRKGSGVLAHAADINEKDSYTVGLENKVERLQKELEISNTMVLERDALIADLCTQQGSILRPFSAPGGRSTGRHVRRSPSGSLQTDIQRFDMYSQYTGSGTGERPVGTPASQLHSRKNSQSNSHGNSRGNSRGRSRSASGQAKKLKGGEKETSDMEYETIDKTTSTGTSPRYRLNTYQESLDSEAIIARAGLALSTSTGTSMDSMGKSATKKEKGKEKEKKREKKKGMDRILATQQIIPEKKRSKSRGGCCGARQVKEMLLEEAGTASEIYG